jgi:hypothetical protein
MFIVVIICLIRASNHPSRVHAGERGSDRGGGVLRHDRRPVRRQRVAVTIVIGGDGHQPRDGHPARRPDDTGSSGRAGSGAAGHASPPAAGAQRLPSSTTAATGQSYQDFANGFTCSGATQVSETGENGKIVGSRYCTTPCQNSPPHNFTSVSTILAGSGSYFVVVMSW